jgi:uncharacterized protein YcfJ
MSSISKNSLAAAAAVALLAGPVAARAAEYATVISATPVTGSVTTPRQECVNGEQSSSRNRRRRRAVGAIAGGVIGNQFGTASVAPLQPAPVRSPARRSATTSKRAPTRLSRFRSATAAP